MQTDPITITCVSNDTGQICTTPSFFSGGEMFISLCLIILILIAIISIISQAIFSIKINKTYLGVNQLEGKEIYHL